MWVGPCEWSLVGELRPRERSAWGGQGGMGTVMVPEFVLNKMLTNIISFFPSVIQVWVMIIMLNLHNSPSSLNTGSHLLSIYLAPGPAITSPRFLPHLIF